MKTWFTASKRLQCCLAFVLSFALVATPLFSLSAYAETPATADAVLGAKDGQADARHDTDAIWYLIGCCGAEIGVIVAYFMTPDVPGSKLLGKSPEYASAYHDAYVAASKKAREKKAVIGCCTNMAIGAIIYLVAASVAHDDADPGNHNPF